MGVRAKAEMVATSRADELSFRALAEIIAATSDEEVRIVGGQMVGLLLTAFPVDGVAPRRTRDADTAITTELDLLVPSLDGRFHATEHGGRAFDAAPGLALALAADPIEIDAAVTMLDGVVRTIRARVPSVETAVVIKASAYRSRGLDRDVDDLYRLLEIAQAYPPDSIGGWRLRDAGLTGARGDAVRVLHDVSRRTRRMKSVDFPPARLAALIGATVAPPV